MYKLVLYILIAFGFINSALSQQSSLAEKYFEKANKHFTEAHYDSTLYYLQQSIPASKNAQNWELYLRGQHKKLACYIRQGEYELAQELDDEIKEFKQEKKIENKTLDAEFLNVEGELLLNKGSNDDALQKFETALNIFIELKEEKTSEAALCYSNLGVVYWNTGNNFQALDHHRKALSIRRNLYSENHPSVAASYNNIGLVYSSSDYDKAAEYYELALNIYQKIYPESHPSIAIAYNNLGIIFRQTGDYIAANEYFNKSLDISKAVYGDGHPNEAFDYTNLGEVALEQEKFEEALNFQEKALKIYKDRYGDKHPEVASTYNLIGSVHAKQGNYTEALDAYQEAICANITNFNDKDILSNPSIEQYLKAETLLASLELKAQNFEALHYHKTLRFKDLKMALETYEICDKLIDQIRLLRTNESDKIALGATASDVYEKAISLAVVMSELTANPKKYLEKAFYFSEKSKLAVLLGAISDTNAKQFANIPDSLIVKENALKDEITLYEQKLLRTEDIALSQEYHDKLFDLKQQYLVFIKKLETEFPSYYELKYDVNMATSFDIQEILDNQTALLSYYIAKKNKRLYIFYISKKKYKVINIPMLEKFNGYIAALKNAIKYDMPDIYHESAYPLFEQLFPNKLPSKIKNLIIIPDGSLGTIPFEALVTKKHEKEEFFEFQYLIYDFAISYSYSATLLTQKSKSNTANSELGSVLLCAPVSFGKGSTERNILYTLPGTESEVNQIKELFENKNLNAVAYLNEHANEDLIKSDKISEFKYLHFATHGIVNQEHPALSQIFLSNTKSKEDGDLFAGEIYNLRLNADLVALSACQTGLGKVSEGEGVIGLSRAMIFAGAQNLLVSFWSVSDEATSQLMVDFYSSFLNQSGPQLYNKPLRDAKLKMLKNEDYANPNFWAPFILIGE